MHTSRAGKKVLTFGARPNSKNVIKNKDIYCANGLLNPGLYYSILMRNLVIKKLSLENLKIHSLVTNNITLESDIH